MSEWYLFKIPLLKTSAGDLSRRPKNDRPLKERPLKEILEYLCMRPLEETSRGYLYRRSLRGTFAGNLFTILGYICRRSLEETSKGDL